MLKEVLPTHELHRFPKQKNTHIMMNNAVRLLLVGLLLGVFVGCSRLPDNVSVRSDIDLKETANYIALTPKTQSFSSTGLLFYPGGLVTPQAYIPTLQELVAMGYPVIIIKATGNLAINNIGKAKEHRNAIPAVRRWVVGGHSLGGAVACRDVQRDPDLYEGVVLWASFPGNAGSIADWQGAALSIWAEFDNLSDAVDIEENQVNMPSAQVVDWTNFPTQPTDGTTLYYEIKGGNHAQFGDYGPQNGDGEATITRTEQQALIVEAMRRFFNANQW